MQLKLLTEYLAAYLADHPEHADLEVYAEAEGGCVLASTNDKMQLVNTRRDEEPPAKLALMFPEFPED